MRRWLLDRSSIVCKCVYLAACGCVFNGMYVSYRCALEAGESADSAGSAESAESADSAEPAESP
jgi:hypothetical protein